MTSLIAQPQLMTTAADAAEIETVIGAARAAAAGPTTSLVVAAQDEVSAVTAALFNAYGQQYQALLQRATTFHDRFVAALSASGNAYAGAEAAASNALRTIEADAQALLAGNAGPAAASVAGAATAAGQVLSVAAGDPTVTTLVLGASGLPIPPPDYIAGIPPLYIDPFFGAGTNVGVFTPEGLYPLTGIKDLTFDVSVARGLTILNNSIQTAIQTAALKLTSSATRRAPPSCHRKCRRSTPPIRRAGACYPPV